MDNKGVENDEDKIKFIGGHLKGKAWDWFEPILREKDTVSRADWSDRTERILGSSKESKKALNQVLEKRMKERKRQTSYRNFTR